MKRAVVGLNFGDEGKGLVTDYLSGMYNVDFIVRFSGGQQAGHMVHNGNNRHIFSNFGSGSLNGVPTYWEKECTVDPIGVVNEYVTLLKLGISPELYIDKLASVTTPYDVEANAIMEKEYNHGSVGLGIGKTLERESKFYSLKFIDLFYQDILIEKLKNIAVYYNKLGVKVDFSKIEDFLIFAKSITQLTGIHKADRSILENKNIIYEGSQGLMLDPNLGFFPNVTYPSLIPPKDCDEYYFVTRAYLTRHGNGFLPNEDLDFKKPKKNETETNLDGNGFQGNFRKAVLDLSMIEYALERLDYVRKCDSGIVITCIDQMNDFCFTYENNLHTFTDKDEFLEGVSKIFKGRKIMFSDGDSAENIHIFN